MMQHLLNKSHSENRKLKSQLKNNRAISFLSWFLLAAFIAISKQTIAPILALFAIVYFYMIVRGKL